MEAAIRVERISKQYAIGSRRGDSDSLRELAASFLSSPFRRFRRGAADAAAEARTFHALRDVSFEVARGEVVGIIGRNGAGKSTLLKILSRITAPTSGRATIEGRVGSLLEVGTGFHPDLTGRENVYLNGAVLGMRRAEIRRKFDEIVAFAEVDRFLDTPVKRYSSGMYVRLAFAVAAHLEPEILIVDEVLAVGDAQFQRKCMGKMGDAADSGRTVLFVSHNMQAVSTLTRRCLMLSGGRLAYSGPTEGGIAAYLREGGSGDRVYEAPAGEAGPAVARVEVRTSEPGGVQVNGKPMEIAFDLVSPEPLPDAALAFQVLDPLGRPVLHLFVTDAELPVCRAAGRFRIVCRLPALRLFLGSYTLSVHFAANGGRRKLQALEGICPFEVAMYGMHRDYPWRPGQCVYLEESEWRAEKG